LPDVVLHPYARATSSREQDRHAGQIADSATIRSVVVPNLKAPQPSVVFWDSIDGAPAARTLERQWSCWRLQGWCSTMLRRDGCDARMAAARRLI
jgi:hypothetical protein